MTYIKTNISFRTHFFRYKCIYLNGVKTPLKFVCSYRQNYEFEFKFVQSFRFSVFDREDMVRR